MAVKQNTLQIEGIKKSLDSLEQRINDAERYSRLWNLRLYGVHEKSDENIKATVKDICR